MAGYTGTVTQGSGATLTVGSSGFAQSAGTFTGGNSAIGFNGAFTLSGGTFTSTSGTVTAIGAWSVTGGTFAANNGTVQFFNGNNQSLTVTGSHTLHHVTIGGNIYSDVLNLATGTTLTVTGTLNLAGAYLGYPPTVHGGSITALGPIIQGSSGATGTTVLTVGGTGAQTLAGGGTSAYLLPLDINKPAGTLTLDGTITTTHNWTYTAGTVDPGTSIIQFFNGNNQSLTVTGSQTFNQVTIGGNPYSDVLTLGTGTNLTVTGTLNLAGAYLGYPPTVNGGSITALGNVIQGSSGATGTTVLIVGGSGAQTLTGGGTSAYLLPLEISKPAGTLSLVGTITTTRNWTYTAGTVDPGTSIIQFFNGNNQSLTVTGSQTFNQVTIGGNPYSDVLTLATGTNLTVTGTLNLAGAYLGYPPTVNGGSITALGNVIQGSSGATGTTVLIVGGSGAQTLTGGGTSAYLLPLEINKPAGTLTLVGTITTTRNWTYTAGTVDPGTSIIQFFNGNNQSLTVTGSQTFNQVTIGGSPYSDVLTLATGTNLTVTGTLNLAGAYLGYPPTVNGGGITALGNVIQGSSGATGTTVLTIGGSGAQTLTGGGASAYLLPLNINKPAGTLTLDGTITTTRNWTYTAGTLDAGSSTVRFFNGNNQSLAVTGSHTLNHVTIGGNYYSDVLTLASGTNLTTAGTLNFAGAYAGYPPTVNGGSITALGNVVQGSAGAAGSTLVSLAGSSAQSWSSGGGKIPGAVVSINKPSGTVTLGSNVSVNTTNQSLSIDSGILNLAGYNLTVNNVLSVGAAGQLAQSGTGTVTAGTKTFQTGSTVVLTGDGDGASDNYIVSDIGTVFSNLEVNSTDGTIDTFSLGANIQVNGTLTFTSGNIDTGIHRVVIPAGGNVVRTNGHVNGNLQKAVGTGSSVTVDFEVGDSTTYSPVNVTVAAVSAAGSLTARGIASDHPGIGASGLLSSKSVNRYWTLTNGGVAFSTYSAVFNYAAGDIDIGASPAAFEVRNYDGSWSAGAPGLRNPTNTQATGLTSFGDFALGEISSQTIAFGALAGKTFGDPAFSLSATASSGLPVDFSVVSGPASVTGNVLTLTGAGTIVVRALQAGNLAYYPAATVDQSLIATKASATLTLGQLNAVYDGTPRPATATSAPIGGLALTLTYDGSTVAPSAIGSYAVVATITDANYEGSATGTLVITPASQFISFGAVAPKTFGDPPFAVSAHTSSGLPPIFSIVSGPATITGNTIRLTGAGTVVVRAAQPGNPSYRAALNVDQAFTVAKAPATLTLENLSQVYDGTPKRVTATTTAPVGTSVALTYAGNTTPPTAAGSYAVVAALSDPNYAGSVTGTLTIARGTQTISFGPLGAKIEGDPAFTLSATTSSGLPPAFSVISGPATISGDIITLTGAGTVVVRASQPGNATYLPAPDVDQSFDVGSGHQTFYFSDRGEFAAFYDRARKIGMIAGIIPGTSEGFAVTFTPDTGGNWTASGGNAADDASPPRARTLRGQLTETRLAFSIDGVDSSFVAALSPSAGETAAHAGCYIARKLGLVQGDLLVIIGAQGQAYALAKTSSRAAGTMGSINPAGELAVAAATGFVVEGRIDSAATTLEGSVQLPGTGPANFAGLAHSTPRTDRLMNLSARGRITGGGVLVSGFVVRGRGAGQILVRAIGPGLTAFGVQGAPANLGLKLFQDGAQIAENDHWDTAANPNVLVATTSRLGAFALAPGSGDSALLLNLAPGNYTAHILPQGSGGVALAEIYESEPRPTAAPDGRKFVNLSTLGNVSPDDGALIGGFVITGNFPKRILVRAAGPALANFGLTSWLSQPALALYSGQTLHAENHGWATPSVHSATAAEISAAARSTGAFPFAPGSKDAALLITVAPGSYTAQINGVAGATGVALIEIYEVFD